MKNTAAVINPWRVQ